MKNDNKEYYKKFGENLQNLITKKRKDVITIASVGNIEQKQVYRVLNGEHGASLKTLIALAKGLDVHPKELFDFKFDFDKE